MSSFTITVDNIFKFADLRFQRTSLAVQQQVVRWLRLLTQLQITVPVTLLLKMLANGLLALSPSASTSAHHRLASTSATSSSFALTLTSSVSASASADLCGGGSGAQLPLSSTSALTSTIGSPLLVRLSRRGLVPATIAQLQPQPLTSLQRGHEILDALDADGLLVVDSLLHRELLQCSQLECDDLVVFHYGTMLQLLFDQVILLRSSTRFILYIIPNTGTVQISNNERSTRIL